MQDGPNRTVVTVTPLVMGTAAPARRMEASSSRDWRGQCCRGHGLCGKGRHHQLAAGSLLQLVCGSLVFGPAVRSHGRADSGRAFDLSPALSTFTNGLIDTPIRA